MSTNIPSQSQLDSSTEIKSFFNNFFNDPISFPAAEIDAVVGFFMKRGFEEQSAKSTAIILMSQARIDNVNIFEVLDTLKGFTSVQLNQVVTTVLNNTRDKISILGFKLTTVEETFESRNIRL
jgi:hypothetical protein